MDKTPQIAEEQTVMTMDKAKKKKKKKKNNNNKQSFKDTEVSVSVFSADTGKSEEISRWRPIDKALAALHSFFFLNKDVFRKSALMLARK